MMATEGSQKPEPKKQRPEPRTGVPPTKADARRAEELIEKHGWQHLRDKR